MYNGRHYIRYVMSQTKINLRKKNNNLFNLNRNSGNKGSGTNGNVSKSGDVLDLITSILSVVDM